MPTEYTGQQRVISVRVGDEFVVALDGNPTAGYGWEAHSDGSVLELLDRSFAAAGSGIGSGGIERFRFKAVAPAAGELRMTYRRPWEVTPAQELIFQLRISP